MLVGTVMLSVALALSGQNEPPPGIRGTAEAIDGDTIRVAGWVLHMSGISAPDLSDTMGPESAANMLRLVEGASVECTPNGLKVGHIYVASCMVRGETISWLQVEQGYARDCPRLSGGWYSAAEARAKDSGRDLSKSYALPSYCL